MPRCIRLQAEVEVVFQERPMQGKFREVYDVSVGRLQLGRLYHDPLKLHPYTLVGNGPVQNFDNFEQVVERLGVVTGSSTDSA